MNPWLRGLGMLAPHGLWLAARRWSKMRSQPPIPWDILQANSKLAGTRYGERCFILGNGPSAKKLDISSLQGETIFSVSNGYLHQDYEKIQPQYHCVPQISYERMTESDVVAWFTEMHKRLGYAVLFLSTNEEPLVRKFGLFPRREVYYLAFRDNFDERRGNDLVDLSRLVPRVESVPVMVLMVAMYLGFKDICLLGVDHDHFKTGIYQYAFNLDVQQNKDFSVDKDGHILTSRHDDFQSLARLWRQYRVLNRIAEANDIRIFNATPGGELDEFPRLNLDEWLRIGCQN